MNDALHEAVEKFCQENDWRMSKKITTLNPLKSSELPMLTEGELKNIRRDFTDVPKARFLDDNCNRISYVKSFSKFYPIIRELSTIAGGFVIPTGFYYYPIGGFCGWHTNSDNPGKRFYLTWSEQEGHNYFRYIDCDSGECITKFDKKGWSLNQFEARSDKPLWHCVGCKTRRVSIGFKLEPEHWLNDHFMYFDPTCEISKGNNSFNNMYNACHSLTRSDDSADNLDWTFDGFTGRVPLRLFDHIFFEVTTDIPLCQISWKCKDNITLKDFNPVNDALPCVLVNTTKNPHNLPFRAIDGSHKLCKLKNKGADTAKALIIDESTFIEKLIELDLM